MGKPICCVEICKYGSQPDQQDRALHKFPLNNRSLLEIWLNKIGADETFVPTEDSVVCSAHFRINDYVKENGIYGISPLAFPTVYLKEGDYDVHSFMDDEDDTQTMTPIVIHVRGNKSSNSNVENMNSNEVISSKYYSLDECVDNTVHENSQNYEEMHCSSIGNISHYIDSNISNSNISKNIQPCQNDNLEVSNQMYLTINMDQYEMSSSNVDSNKPFENSTSKLRKFRKFKSIDKTSSFNVKNKCSNRSVISTDSKQTQTNPEQRSSNEPKLQYKKEVPEKFVNQLRMYARKNKRLIAKLKSVTTRQQDLLDTKIKYLVLKEKVLETEEKLLAYGIDTTEFPAFRFTNSNNRPSSRDPEYDVLLECTLEEIRQAPTHSSSTL